ncbi:MAG: nucleotidyltransferase family protein [Hyphomicrobiaceae bacterium]|nr:nucleotidyltransferase family protein [Hyphomicrobiaceae bacterium]
MSATPLAFVLAAGLGTRMRPLTDHVPKPLVRLAGRALIDHVLDRIAEAGIAEAVVNVHYLADLIETHLATRNRPRVSISDEREALLETGGGVRKALGRLAPGPFLVHNSDTVWIEREGCNLRRLIETFDAERMDGLLLLADRTTSLGYAGRGDFLLDGQGRITKPAKGETVSHVFAGASIATPRLMRETPDGPFSLNLVWDRAIAEGRLYGIELNGTWMHVGDPSALARAEALIERTVGK